MAEDRIDRLFDIVSELREEVAGLKSDMAAMKSMISRYNGGLGAQSQKLDDLEKLTYKIVGGVILASVIIPVTVSVIVTLMMG